MNFKTTHTIIGQNYLHHTPCEVEETAEQIIVRYYNNISAYVKREKWLTLYAKLGFKLNNAEA